MERYTMRQLTAMLGVDGNTVRRWLEDLAIVRAPDKYDGRRRYVSHDDAMRLAVAHDRVLLPLSADLPKTVVGCHRLILQLRAEIARLETAQNTRTTYNALGSDSDDLPIQKRDRPTRSYSTQRSATSRRPGMPDGWESLDGFCRKHHIPHSTVAKAIESGHLPAPHRGEWAHDRAIVRNGLDEEMQAAILARYGSPGEGGESD